MSDTERSKQADNDTVVRRAEDAHPSAESMAEPGAETAKRPRLADRLMGRAGHQTASPPSTAPSGGKASTDTTSTDTTSTKAKENGKAPSSPARPQSSEAGIEPTGSAASAVPAPPGVRRDAGGGNSDQAAVSTVLSAGPVVGTGRPDFAAGVPTTVSTAQRENPQVGIVEPKDLPANAEDTGSSTQGDNKAAPNREMLTKGRPTTRRTRKARLRLASVDPWSVMKMAFLFSMAAGIALVVAVMVIWFIVGQSGLFDAINQAVNDALSAPGDQNSFDLSRFVSGGRVIGSAMVLAVIDVLLLTALATVGAFLYNLGATLLGGFEVTLADD